ncbi:PDZ domain-containing protein [Halalkalibacter krulwichiae]|uniref:Cell division topological determinant MinJ n=1 Tax=Halalkalibacter krulwichiae TaxID=199441 RepID=A0A1X9MM09_9BACI|nr:PDZ domain-containing protein [Halalkalibacter krulwichiae]ARK32062.1 Cell division topological determinant MinJ [Halalkalibacter krulwichiae]
MITDILHMISVFILYFLANPVLYIGIAILYLMANYRVKKERMAFHTRVYRRMADFTIPFLPALLAGIYVSVVTIALGIVVSWEWLAIVAAFYLVLAVTTQLRWVTPVYALGLLLLLYGLEPLLGRIDFLKPIYEILTQVPLVAVASLLIVLMIVEGFLIRINGAVYTSPRLEKSKRGKWIGLHVAKRLWIIPVILFIPEGVIPAISYWPAIHIGDVALQPVLVPFLIGFQQVVRGSIPTHPIKAIGNRVLGLGFLFSLFAIGSYFVPVLAVVLGVLAIVGRELLTYQTKALEEKRSAIFATKSKGCIVLGVLPGSPAEKMKISVGETIAKVNGQAVNSETSFYDALQLNSAFCKLEVLNHDGEVRFAQGALYDGEHHQVGILLVKDDLVLQDSIT